MILAKAIHSAMHRVVLAISSRFRFMALVVGGGLVRVEEGQRLVDFVGHMPAR